MIPDKTHKIIAPAGCGKTTRLLELVDEFLSQGTNPERIVFTTFTRSGAYEARDRACSKFNLTPTQLPFFRTMHSLCYRLLGDQKIMQFKDWLECARLTKVAFGNTHPNNSETDNPLYWSRIRKGDDMLGCWAYARNTKMTLREAYTVKECSTRFPFRELEVMVKEIENYKNMYGKIDFTDILEQFVRRKPRLGIDYVIIDEAQDLTKLQWDVVEHLSSLAKKTYVAGDDDQAIYDYAGAVPSVLIDMKGTLEIRDKSYRIPASVQKVSQSIVSKIGKRIEKTIQPRDGDDGKVIQCDLDQIDMSKGNWMLICRNQKFFGWLAAAPFNGGYLWTSQRKSTEIDMKCVKAIIEHDFIHRGGMSTAGEYAKAVTCIMKKGTDYVPGLLKKLKEMDSEQPVNEEILLKLGLKHVQPWQEATRHRTKVAKKEVEYVERLFANNERRNPRIHISTIHAVKGQECDNVVVMPDMTWQTHRAYLENPDPEHRLFYVAVTRAKKNLFLLNPLNEKHYVY